MKNNISFVLKIQDVHRFLKNTSNKRFTICNWIFVITALFSTTTMLVSESIRLKLPHYNLVCGVILLCFDANMVYATRLITLLCDKVHLWNIAAQNLHQIDHSDNEMYYKEMFQAFANLLECYDICRASFQHMV